MAAHGGLITVDDLKEYNAVEREAARPAPIAGYDIVTAPPPSSGGIGILQMLGVLEGTGYEKAGAGFGRDDPLHHRGDAPLLRRPQRASGRSRFRRRSRYRALIDPEYITKLRASIDPERATQQRFQYARGSSRLTRATRPRTFRSSTRTAMQSVVTYTLNGGYGSGVTAPGLGFLLNNEMDDFAAQARRSPNMYGLIQGEANAIQPGKTPLSSMTPTIVLQRRQAVPGRSARPAGRRIINSVLRGRS